MIFTAEHAKNAEFLNWCFSCFYLHKLRNLRNQRNLWSGFLCALGGNHVLLRLYPDLLCLILPQRDQRAAHAVGARVAKEIEQLRKYWRARGQP